MNWYLLVLSKYTVFGGRARRKEYWYFTLVHAIVSICLTFLDEHFRLYVDESPQGILSTLYLLLVFLPMLAVTIRRLHDSNRTGWWFFIMLVPIIGPLVLLYFLVQPSNDGTNQYGPNPKTESM
ncbi:DUF805 domain-containing protein [Vibrio profundum]|uniref:DUF805 domain-containing protein n=1 Tax=Vibrio profundum TaxID=2910247 RepID=UPI003D0E528A